jgi:hypothetical protein
MKTDNQQPENIQHEAGFRTARTKGDSAHRLVEISAFIRPIHMLPQVILMEPNGIGIPQYELIHWQAVDRSWASNLLLLSVYENEHESLSAFLPRSLLSRRQLSLRLGHGNQVLYH